MDRFTGLLGLVVILAVCILFSKHKAAIRPSIIVWGVSLQLIFAFLVLRTPVGLIFKKASDGVNALLDYSEAGSNSCLATSSAAARPTLA